VLIEYIEEVLNHVHYEIIEGKKSFYGEGKKYPGDGIQALL